MARLIFWYITSRISLYLSMEQLLPSLYNHYTTFIYHSFHIGHTFKSIYSASSFHIPVHPDLAFIGNPPFVPENTNSIIAMKSANTTINLKMANTAINFKNFSEKVTIIYFFRNDLVYNHILFWKAFRLFFRDNNRLRLTFMGDFLVSQTQWSRRFPLEILRVRFKLPKYNIPRKTAYMAWCSFDRRRLSSLFR